MIDPNSPTEMANAMRNNYGGADETLTQTNPIMSDIPGRAIVADLLRRQWDI